MPYPLKPGESVHVAQIYDGAIIIRPTGRDVRRQVADEPPGTRARYFVITHNRTWGLFVIELDDKGCSIMPQTLTLDEKTRVLQGAGAVAVNEKGEPIRCLS